MRTSVFLTATLVTCFGIPAFAQTQRTSVPLGDAIGKALERSSLTAKGIRPFHIRVAISEPENPQSPYQGTIEEWWLSPDRWRREVTDKDGTHQTIVVSAGRQTEADQGEYFPLWLRSFVSALFDPVPDASKWTAAGITIDQTTLPNGMKSDACARAKSQLGNGNRATDAFSTVCFDGEGRLKFVGSPRYSMEFSDYRSFSKKQIPHKFVDDPEPGTKLVGAVNLLEEIKSPDKALFTPLPTQDNRFQSVTVPTSQLAQLTESATPITWPTVHSGNTRGHLAVYIGVDSNGRVREAWPLNSDNAGLEDSARDQIKNWKINPVVGDSGTPVQIDGGLGFYFDTAVADPLPVLSDRDARELATNIVEPKLPPNTLPKGTRYRVRIAVDATGKFAGGGAGDTEIPGTVKAPGPGVFAAIMAMHEWKFKPLLRNGKPQYFLADMVFTAN